MHKYFTYLKNLLPALGVFFGTALIFFCIDRHISHFLGSDIYYHMKHALLVQETGTWGYVFSWIPYQFLGTMPVDPYILHHTALALCMSLFTDPILATMIFAATLSAGVFLSYYIAVKRLQVVAPILFTWGFFIASPVFMYRLLLDRPFTISIFASILLIPLLIKKKPVAIFFLAGISILSYNLAMLLIPTVIVYTIIVYWQTKQIFLKPLIAVLGGILVGLLIHPDTIHYIHLIFVHLFTVFSLKLSGVSLPLGTEIMHPSIWKTIFSHMWSLLLVAVSTIISSVLYKRKALSSYTIPVLLLGALQFMWLPVLLYVPRGAEYWVPFAWLYIAVSLSAWHAAYPHYLKRIPIVLRVFILTILSFSLLNYSMLTLLKQLPNKMQQQEHKAALIELTDVLKEQDQTVLFYPAWSLFTELFFELGETHQYIAGFDPTHMYTYNVDIYEAWHSISTAGSYCLTEVCADSQVPLRTAIPNIFNSNLVIIPKLEKFEPLQYALDAEETELLFENNMYWLYRFTEFN